ncbi:hypothetical protein BMETH_12587048152144, partial [methanotrophic bacterial endosymbiont of Bathymodiolus sp.]
MNGYLSNRYIIYERNKTHTNTVGIDFYVIYYERQLGQ